MAATSVAIPRQASSLLNLCSSWCSPFSQDWDPMNRDADGPRLIQVSPLAGDGSQRGSGKALCDLAPAVP